MTTPRKPCPDCGSTTRKTGNPKGRCTTCHRAFKKAQAARRHDAYVQKTYNKPPGWFEAQIALQGGLCWACRKPLSKSVRGSVDHDHACCKGNTSCGRCVRSILHRRCNTVLGWYHDDPQVFANLATYLIDGGFKQ